MNGSPPAATRTGGATLQRFIPLARFINGAPLGRTSPAERVLLADERHTILSRFFLKAPTIVAWDLGSLCRILPLEARSP